MRSKSQTNTKTMLLAGLIASSMVAFAAGPQPKQEAQKPGQTPRTSPPAASPSSSLKTSSTPASSANWHAFESTYYKRTWGVDIVGVRLVSSGSMLRFTYRVLDAEKAKMLNDKRWNPYLIDEPTGAKLGVPEMEKVGKLRQATPPEDGHVYWMVFGNPGGLVKRGNRVSIIIGSFRAEALVVE